MVEPSVAYRLLSLFTSPERAEAIEGDLLEERPVYGRLWFAVNVVTTTLALWRQAVELELVRTAVLAALAVALSCLVCGALALARVELAALGLSGAGTLLLIAAFAFLLGAALVRAAPALGAPAAVAASLALLLLFLYSQVDLRAEQVRGAAGANVVMASVSALAALIRDLAGASLLYLLPFNLGSALVRGRQLRRRG